MAYFTQEQIDKAKEIDVLSYLQNKNPDELVYESRGTYHTRTHDSLKISNGKWYWFSRGIGGITALEYLIQVEEYSFTEAVEHLINQKGIEKKYIPKIQLTEKEKIKQELQKFKGFWHSLMKYFQNKIGFDKDEHYKYVSDDLCKNGVFDDNDNRIVNDVARKIKPADELNNTNIKKKNNMELK